MTALTRRGPLTRRRAATLALHMGWMFTAATLAVVWVDHATGNVLASHIRAGYPDYSQARINSAAVTYLLYLSAIGALGLTAWFATIRAVSRDGRWVRPSATVMFILAVGLSLTNLLIKDTSGQTGLPPLLGWVGLLPCLPGLAAVALLWTSRNASSQRPPGG